MKYLHQPVVYRRTLTPNRSAAQPSPDAETALAIRETFMDRPAERVDKVEWHWPKQMLEVGSCEAVMYTSDKWKRKGHFEDYKHVAEGPQRLAVVAGFLRDFESDPSCRKELKSPGVTVDLDEPMPDSFAVLAPLIGLQCRLYTMQRNGDLVLPSDEENLYQVDTNPEMVTLGAGKHPLTGETFLVIYSKNAVLAMVTGDKLDVWKDGIVG